MKKTKSEQPPKLNYLENNKYSGDYVKTYLIDPVIGEEAIQQSNYGTISDIGLFKSLKTRTANPHPSNY